MKVIRIVLTPAQKTKLRKGMKIRINAKNRAKEGQGLVLMVNDKNYNHITKTFESSRGKEFMLSEKELDVNENPEQIQDQEVKEAIEGSGLFSRIKKGFEKVSTFYKGKVRDTPVGSAIRKAVKTGSKVAIKSAINSLSGTPLSPLMPALNLANAKYGDKGIDMAIKKLGLGMHAMVGNGLRLGGEIDPEAKAIQEVETLLEEAPYEVMEGSGLTVKRGKAVHGGIVKLQDKKIMPNYLLDKQNMLPITIGKGMHGDGLRLRGDGLRAGVGLRLGKGNEIIGMDQPPATHALRKAPKLVKVSNISGRSR